MHLRLRLSLVLLLLLGTHAWAQPADDFNQPEFPPRPKPTWVELIDQRDSDPRMAGLFAPRGIKVEIFALAPLVTGPERLAFGADGTLHVLQTKAGAKTYELRALHDRDGDGRFDEASAVMTDWESPGGILLHDGWIVWTSAGNVLRRRPHDADLLSKLQAAAEAKRGPPTIATADGKWIEQTLVRGLAGIGPAQGGGLTLGTDGWLYITAGSGDHRAESWDDSRAVALRTGAIFRMRPDGSQLQEYARGLHQPRGGIAFDELGNAFHLDDDLAGGGKFEGVRLLHVLEGGDYGWRERAGGKPDLARAAAWGERPGALPGILKTGSGSPSGLLIISGTQFPEFLRGVLVYPDPDRKLVRGYIVERSGQTFKVAAQFDLLRSDDANFRPRHAIQGPDGAIYIASDQGDQGRIYRLSWGGNDDHPAIPLAPSDSWQQIASSGEDQLTALLSSDEFELRRRAALELISRARSNPDLTPSIAARATTIAYDDSRRPVVRAAAMSVAAHVMDATAFEALLLMLGHDDPDIQRLASQALADHPPATAEPRQRLVKSLQEHLFVQHPGVPHAMLLAHGKVAADLDNAEWAFEATSVSYRPHMGPEVFQRPRAGAGNDQRMPPASCSSAISTSRSTSPTPTRRKRNASKSS